MPYKEHEQTIQATLHFIETHLTEDLRLALLAQHAGYSRFHFHRIFRKMIGKSVVDYIRERRMTRAAKDLISTDRRVVDIAFDYDFGSQESFTRAFHKTYDMTPGRYRKLLRKLTDRQRRITNDNK